MARPERFGKVASAYARMAVAVVRFRKAVAACADDTDAVRLAQIEANMPDMAKLHGTLTAIARAEGTDPGTLDGDTPKV